MKQTQTTTLATTGLERKTLSIVIPVYNESERLDLVISALTDKVKWGLFYPQEIIFVDDGSTDDTLQLVRRSRARIKKQTGTKVKILTYPKNKGKGHAITTGMRAASGDYALMMDADMSTPMSELARLQTAAKYNWPLVIGTRKKEFTRVEKSQPWLRQRLGHIYTWLSQTVLGSQVSDFTCGFKLFRHDVYQAVFSRSRINRWGYDSEIIYLTERLGYRVREVAVRWLNDERTHVRAARDGLISFVELLAIRYYDLTGVYNLPDKKLRASAPASISAKAKP